MDAAFTAAGKENTNAATLSGARVGVGSRLRVPDLTVGTDERVLVTGPNEAGKTRLLHLMAERLRPDSGSVSVPVRIGLLRQEDTVVRSGHSVLQTYAAGLPGLPENHREGLTTLGLFRPRDLDRPVADLSAGQRRRVEVGRLTSGVHDLLLLDEPTNHLSPGLVEDLEEALDHYSGALVMVRHDRRLREGFEGRRLVLRSGEVIMDTVTRCYGMST